VCKAQGARLLSPPNRKLIIEFAKRQRDRLCALSIKVPPESGWITAQVLTVDGGRMDYIGHA